MSEKCPDNAQVEVPTVEEEVQDKISKNIAINDYESCTITDFSHASYNQRLAWWKQEAQ